MTNWMHPNSVGINFVKLFPEIYKKYLPIRFQLPGNRFGDFIASSMFLYGSKKTQDINMIFSAIQRLYGYKHKDFYMFLKSKGTREQLFNLEGRDFDRELDKIYAEYLQKYGMNKQIINFYNTNTTADEKVEICKNFPLPAGYKPHRKHGTEEKFKLIFSDILLYKRNRLDHAAQYIPFHNSNSKQAYSYIEIEYKDKTITILSSLTFDYFYELTRKTMAHFWLSEYELYLKNGGKEIIKAIIKETTTQIQELNSEEKVTL